MRTLKNRRDDVFENMSENSVMIIFSGVSKIVSEDEFYPFMSNRNFFYLTNIEQENSILMLIKGISETKTYLFIDEYDELKEKWTGKRLTDEEAYKISEINNVYHTNCFENMVKLALSENNNQYGKISKLYLDFTPELKIKPEYSTLNYKEFIENEYPNIEIENLVPMLTSLRMKKSSDEVENLLLAINATNAGLAKLINTIKPGMLEKHAADVFEFYGREHAHRDLSFSTICAAGKNATCLHYPTQNDTIKENDLVLFDLGYKHNGYCADISRTYPVNGVFTGLQKEVYQAVLNCNKAVIDHIRPGMTLLELNNFTKEFLKNECVRIGVLKPEDDISKYYFHGISHHLGLDTHDVSDRKKPLENGNVITVEPGLYLADKGIGVRIEDDILIFDGHAEVLSKGIAKEISDIEKLFKTRG